MATSSAIAIDVVKNIERSFRIEEDDKFLLLNETEDSLEILRNNKVVKIKKTNPNNLVTQVSNNYSETDFLYFKANV